MLRRTLLACLFSLLLVGPAGATWSIVVVNRRTGEVAIGSATCIPRIDLLVGLPTVVPGVGGGVVQASGDSGDLVPLTEGLRAGLAPADILLLVRAADPRPSSLQTGIVSLYPGAPVTSTGASVGAAKRGVVGEVGDLAYAIQGNVLVGGEVVLAAESALLTTPGDLGQKLLAAMEAARDLGGDGRCSCNLFQPTSCGVPPPDFEKSAHVGFLVVARVGDPAPPCVTGLDCARVPSQQEPFHLSLTIRGANAAPSSPDPVDQLAARYATWRAARAGRPDGILSTVDAVQSLPADGRTKRAVTIRLVDLDGVPLDHGGADVRVASAGGARLNAVVGPVVDLGDGRYRFSVASTFRVGTDRLVITAADELVRATLYPFLEVRSEPPAPLHAGRTSLSARAGGVVPFVLALPERAGCAYLLRARLAPRASRERASSFGRAGGPPLLPRLSGALDPAGRAEVALAAPEGLLLSLIGRRLAWSAVVADGARAVRTNLRTNEVELEVLP